MRNSQAKKGPRSRQDGVSETLGPFDSLQRATSYSHALSQEHIIHRLLQREDQHFIEISAGESLQAQRIIQEVDYWAEASRDKRGKSAALLLLLWEFGPVALVANWLRGLDQNAHGELVYRRRSEAVFILALGFVVGLIVLVAWLLA
jgi:hypothetical protein